MSRVSPILSRKRPPTQISDSGTVSTEFLPQSEKGWEANPFSLRYYVRQTSDFGSRVVGAA